MRPAIVLLATLALAGCGTATKTVTERVAGIGEPGGVSPSCTLYGQGPAPVAVKITGEAANDECTSFITKQPGTDTYWTRDAPDGFQGTDKVACSLTLDDLALVVTSGGTGQPYALRMCAAFVRKGAVDDAAPSGGD